MRYIGSDPCRSFVLHIYMYIYITLTSGVRYATIRVNVSSRLRHRDKPTSVSYLCIMLLTIVGYSFKMSRLLIDLYFVSDNMLECVYISCTFEIYI